VNFLDILIFLSSKEKKGFDIEDGYIFIVVFASIFLITYIIYNFDKSYSKTLYLKEILKSPLLYAVLLLFASYAFNSSFGIKEQESNANDYYSYCHQRTSEVILKAIDYVDGNTNIVDYENAYVKFKNIHGCQKYKNDFTKDLNLSYTKINLEPQDAINKIKFIAALNAIHQLKYGAALQIFGRYDLSNETYYNYYAGMALYQKKNFDKALHHFDAHYTEFEQHPNFYNAYAKCILVYKGIFAFKENYRDEKIIEALPILQKVAVYTLQTKYLKVIGASMQYFFRDISFLGLLIALCIFTLWLYYLYYINIYNYTSLKNISIALIIIALTNIILSLFFKASFEIIISNTTTFQNFPTWFQYIWEIGFITEFVKIAPVLFILGFTKLIKDPFDYILYACLSALTFSFFENLNTFNAYSNGLYFYEASIGTIMQLSFSSIAISGFVYNFSIENKFLKSLSHLVFFLTASTLHGFYMYYFATFSLFGLIFEISLFFFLMYYFQILANNAINFSSKFSHYKTFSFYHLKCFLILGLSALFAFEYLNIGLTRSAQAADHFLMHNFLYASLINYLVSSVFFNFDFVKKYWKGFTIFDRDAESSIYRTGAFALLDLVSLRALFASKTAQNYVGYSVLLEPYDYNKNLIKNFSGIRKAKIIDRKIIVPFVNSSDSSQGDPFWFVIKLEDPINLGTTNKQYFLMRFRESDPKFENSEAQLARLHFQPDLEWLDKNILVLTDLNDLGWIDVAKILD